MKHSLCLACLFLLAGAGCAQERTPETPESQFEQLSWLVGTWDRTNVGEGETAFEEWRKGDSGLVGRGVTIAGSDTVFVEQLQLRLTTNGIEYVVVTPGNENPVVFDLTIITDSSFVSENPEHDFPKQIEYHLERNSMTAIISGDGQRMGFAFQKRVD